METSKTETKLLNRTKQKPTIGKTMLSFLALTALTLFIGCSATETNEPKWNDMYEVRVYDIHTETITNEIVTTVFICRQTETNKVVKVAEPVTDFGGYEFEGHNPFDSRGHWKVAPAVKQNLTTAPVVKQNFTTPEFQCVDGSCGIGGDINVPSK